MGKKKDILPEKKFAIYALLQGGKHSHREIARMQCVSHSTVDQYAKNLRGGEETIESKRGKNPSTRKDSDRTRRRIISTVCANREKPLREIKKILEADGIKKSERTLARRISEAGFKCRRPTKKPHLTEKMKRARLSFAKQHQHYTADDWKQVNFNNCIFLISE